MPNHGPVEIKFRDLVGIHGYLVGADPGWWVLESSYMAPSWTGREGIYNCYSNQTPLLYIHRIGRKNAVRLSCFTSTSPKPIPDITVDFQRGKDGRYDCSKILEIAKDYLRRYVKAKEQYEAHQQEFTTWNVPQTKIRCRRCQVTSLERKWARMLEDIDKDQR